MEIKFIKIHKKKSVNFKMKKKIKSYLDLIDNFNIETIETKNYLNNNNINQSSNISFKKTV